MMEGKITLELDYHYEPLENKVYLSHPLFEGLLSLAASNEDLARIQLDALNIAKPKTPIEEIVSDGHQLIAAIQELNELIPGVVDTVKKKLSGGKE